jgi:hypothetical protein
MSEMSGFKFPKKQHSPYDKQMLQGKFQVLKWPGANTGSETIRALCSMPLSGTI